MVLRDWKMKHAIRLQELETLEAEIDKGLSDVVAGRIAEFDAARVIERGRLVLAGRLTSV